MSMELLDLDWFISDGGLAVISGIALGLLAATTVFCFLLWQKGDDDMMNKFIGYLCATIALVGGLIASIQLAHPDGTMDAFLAGSYIFLLATLGGVGFRLFLVIRNKWFTEEKA